MKNVNQMVLRIYRQAKTHVIHQGNLQNYLNLVTNQINYFLGTHKLGKAQ